MAATPSAPLGGDGDAHAGRQHDPLAGGHRDGRGDGGPEPAGEGEGLVDPHDVLHEDDELVAAEAGHRVGGTHDPLEPAGHLDEQVVADGVAERVVDDLEPVEVEEEHRHRTGPAPGPGQGLAQLIHEQPAVGQPGQRVVQGAVQRPPEGRFGRECQGATAAVTRRSVRHIRITLNGSKGLVTPGKSGQVGQATPGPGAGSMVRGGEPAGRPRAGPVPSGAGIGPRNVRTPQGRVLGNPQSGRPAGQCHRK